MKKKNKPNYKKFILAFWILVLIPILLFIGMMISAANGWFGFEPLPSFEELENPQSNQASVVYAANGEIMGTYYYQNRVNVDYEDLSPHLVNALVSTEDERYYSHSGIDLKGLIRAVTKFGRDGGASTITQQLAKMLFSDEPRNKWERIMQKMQEWIIAARLERRYTKNEIIIMYFNRFDFVNNAVGIKTAANTYFNKEPSQLRLNEAATLVGMLKNPSLFNPLRFPDTTKNRRNVVFHQLMRNGFISTEEFDSLSKLPLGLEYQEVDHKEGLAPHFREILRADLKDIFNEKDENGNYVMHKLDGSPYDIYKDGLRIYTTINLKMQKYAEWAVEKHLGGELQKIFYDHLKKKKNYPFDWRVSDEEVKMIMDRAMKRSPRYLVYTGQQCANCGRRGNYIESIHENGKTYYVCKASDCGHKQLAFPKDSILAAFNKPVKMKVFSWHGTIDTVMTPMDSIRYYKSFLQAGVMAMDPHTGYIKAWVGGIDYEHFAYDHVRQGRRQVGSTFKPFVYAVAIDEGFSPCYEVPNVPVVFKKEEYGLKEDWIPKNSDDEYGYNVTLKYGLANSMNTITAWVMKQFGPERVIQMARSMGITSPLDPVPALALGVADVSVYEMVGAFSTFVNSGVYTKPIYLTRIEDKDGNVIARYIPETNEALSPEDAYVMLELLKGVTSYNYNAYKDKMVAGTGIRLRFEGREYGGIPYPIAGKTGTTQNQSDGWFLGATPDLVTGVWVGAADRSVRFSSIKYGQGANMALPIWGYFMNKVYDDPSLKIDTGDFAKPDVPITVDLDCNDTGENSSFGPVDDGDDNIFY